MLLVLVWKISKLIKVRLSFRIWQHALERFVIQSHCLLIRVAMPFLMCMRLDPMDWKCWGCFRGCKTPLLIPFVFSLPQELLVSQNDLGRDYEHCLELQKKANNQESAVRGCLFHTIWCVPTVQGREKAGWWWGGVWKIWVDHSCFSSRRTHWIANSFERNSMEYL